MHCEDQTMDRWLTVAETHVADETLHPVKGEDIADKTLVLALEQPALVAGDNTRGILDSSSNGKKRKSSPACHMPGSVKKSAPAHTQTTT